MNHSSQPFCDRHGFHTEDRCPKCSGQDAPKRPAVSERPLNDWQKKLIALLEGMASCCPQCKSDVQPSLDAFRKSYQPPTPDRGINLINWKTIALYSVKISAISTCTNYDPGAGSDYEYRPSKSEMEMWNKVGVVEDDLNFVMGCGMPSYYYIKPKKVKELLKDSPISV